MNFWKKNCNIFSRIKFFSSGNSFILVDKACLSLGIKPERTLPTHTLTH